MISDLRRLGAWAPWAMLFAVGVGIAVYRIRPFTAGQVGYDSAASVLYFDRIVAGQRLEAFVSATPKALLTAVYGFLHAITGDWRSISVLAVGIYGLNVVLSTILAKRLGGLTAGGFAAVGFLGSYALLEDASASYAVGPALLGWLIAGVALAAPKPRYGIAGLALMLAGLARFETLLVSGAVLLLLVGGTILARRWPVVRPPARAWLLLLGLAAFPIQALHDWLLTGDPFWAETVSVIVSQATIVASPAAVVQLIASHYSGMWPLLALAIPGVVELVRRRRTAILVGLAVLGPGILAFIVFLSIRGVYISARYLYPPDLAFLFTAALGSAWVVRAGTALAHDRMRSAAAALTEMGAWPFLAIAGPLLLGALIALAAVHPYAPLDKGLTKKIKDNLGLFVNETAALPALRIALAAIPGVGAWPPDASARLKIGPGATILAPVLLGPRLAVDLGVPVTTITGSSATTLRPDGTDLRPGQLVYHDRRNDLPVSAFAGLEVDRPTTIDAIRLVPIIANPRAMVWLLRVEAAGAAAAAPNP